MQEVNSYEMGEGLASALPIDALDQIGKALAEHLDPYTVEQISINLALHLPMGALGKAIAASLSQDFIHQLGYAMGVTLAGQLMQTKETERRDQQIVDKIASLAGGPCTDGHAWDLLNEISKTLGGSNG